MKFFKVLLVIVLLLGVLAGGGIIYVTQNLKPVSVDASADEVVVEIEKGMGSQQIAQLLEQNGLIRNELIFRMYLKYKNEGSRMQAGKYALHPSMTIDEMIVKLNSGAVVPEEMIRFTIPEGYTVQQIATYLAEKDIVDEEEFIQLIADTGKFADVSKWVAQIPADERLLFPLEGYMFPETYEMKVGSTAEEIIIRMIEELDRKLTQLPDGWEDKMNEKNLSFHELMTLASLIEREAADTDESTLIASVIYNRLEINMRLQIDATIQYLFGEQRDRVYNSDLTIDSPYNTYENDGIPPGPIASPGLSSIVAALEPEESPYFYYVTKKDGTRQHYFSETYEEHLKYKDLSEQNSK